ncbi:DUF6248 family natural product biosynthesis protein [Spirillospora sp. CA-128828]|uniref:DUF6248 family natural product biosynthesis protein n=1 Tax=Spirillospora sp. CA-128828 TaxID=3240033 RepID=UPI003D8DB861
MTATQDRAPAAVALCEGTAAGAHQDGPAEVRGEAHLSGAPPLTDDRAAWIRANAWTGGMRKTYREVPQSFHRCACQSGLTHWCQIGQHDRCHRAAPQRTEATVICTPGGSHPAHFPADYEHKTDTSATGPRFESIAMVWHADRVCRWICPCGCHDVLFTIGTSA